jgi:hypothetical protein
MSRILSGRRWRVTAAPRTGRAVAAASAALLCAAGTVVAVVAAPAVTAAPTRAAQTRSKLPPVDHQLCYTAKADGKFKIPGKVELVNQFSPRGFVPRIGSAAIHCNPVIKTLPDGKTFKVTNPQGHLLCYRVAATKPQPAPQVLVTNQFGSAALATGQPNLLCLPTWKGLKAPPKQKAPQPPNLSHFTCYPVKPLPGTTGFTGVPPFVLLRDEFAPKPVRAEVKSTPAELCLPTEKIVNGKVSKIVNPKLHLLCFPVSQTPKVDRVWDQNQFGTSVISIGKTTWLCLPSLKTVLTPIDHQLCYNTSAGKYPIPSKVVLADQFSPKGFQPKFEGVAIHCNPVVKTLVTGGGTFPITNPAAHLLCFGIATSKQPAPEVVVTNQFGSAPLIPGQPNLLCLPSWKSLTGPPKQKVVQPPGLSHFTCYPVRPVAGTAFNAPPAVMLQDEFSPKGPVTVKVNPVPQELCLPTVKVVNGKVTKIVNPVAHLLCFQVSPTPIIPRVWDQNQFGTSEIVIKSTRWLCLPSTKRVVTTAAGGQR